MSEREEYTPPASPEETGRESDRWLTAHDQEVAEQRCLKICWHIDRLVEHADQMTRSDLLVAINNLSATADSIARGGQEQ